MKNTERYHNTMKRTNILRIVTIAVLIGAFFFAYSSWKETKAYSGAKQPAEQNNKKAEKKRKKRALTLPPSPPTTGTTNSTVAKILENAPFATSARPNLQAEYFVFLRSADWCPPCKETQPTSFAAAREMMQDPRMCFVYLSRDRSRRELKSLFLKQYKARDIPAVLNSEINIPTTLAQSRAVPYFFILDKNGTLLSEGHAAQLPQVWRNATIKEKSMATTPTKGEKSTMADIWQHCAFYTPMTPAPDAEYYIILQTASWCTFCRQDLPNNIKAHQEMRKDGRVEIVVLSGNESTQKTYAWMKSHEARFAGLHMNDLPKIPNLVLRNTYPSAYVMRADGTHVISGHAAEIIKEWKEHTIGRSTGVKNKDLQHTFATKLSELKVLNDKKIETSANYYLLVTGGSYECLYGKNSPSATNANNQFIRLFSAAYNKRRGSGKKVELIFVNIDPTPETRLPYIEQANAQFPVVHLGDPAMESLEEYMEPNSAFGCLLFDKEGSLLKSDDFNPDDIVSESQCKGVGTETNEGNRKAVFAAYQKFLRLGSESNTNFLETSK